MKNKKKTKDLDISSSIYKIVLNNVFHFPIFFFFFFIDSTDYNSTFTNILKLNIEWQNKDNANTTRRYFKLIPGNRFNALKQTRNTYRIFVNNF